MTTFVRRLVSKKKRRFQSHGFDLDLSYIEPGILAMGYPSQGLEALYRNDIREVSRFLSTFHAERFKIFNLCSEGDYDPAKLGGNVMRIPFANHNPAPLASMLLFCQSATEWLSQNSQNVIVVHCKAGKGRTGFMICALLLYSKRFADTESALVFYGDKRTRDGRGVTIPSQIRYIRYFEDVLANGYRPDRQLLLSKIVFRAAASDLHCRISSSSCVVSSMKDADAVKQEGCLTYVWKLLRITGDIKVEVFNNREVRQFYLWFNTSYVDSTLLLGRDDFDKPCKSVGPEVQVLLQFLPSD